MSEAIEPLLVGQIRFQGRLYQQPFGIPYAKQHVVGRQVQAECPRCHKRIPLTARKDFESHTGSEYSDHYFREHAEADGMIRLAGVWYEPATT